MLALAATAQAGQGDLISNAEALPVAKDLPGPAESSFSVGVDAVAYVVPVPGSYSNEGGEVKLYELPVVTQPAPVVDEFSYGSFSSFSYSFGSEESSMESSYFTSYFEMVSYLNPGCEDDDGKPGAGCNPIPSLIPGNTGLSPDNLVGDIEISAEAEALRLSSTAENHTAQKSKRTTAAVAFAGLSALVVGVAAMVYREQRQANSALQAPLAARDLPINVV